MYFGFMYTCRPLLIYETKSESMDGEREIESEREVESK